MLLMVSMVMVGGWLWKVGLVIDCEKRSLTLVIEVDGW